MKVVFLDRDTMAPSVVLKRPVDAQQWEVYGSSSGEQAAARLRDADIVITNKVPIDASVIAAASRLRLVAVAATGYDIVDIAHCQQAGIAVANVRGYASHTVSEHCFALMLAWRRSVLAYRQDVLDGRWQRAGQFCFFGHPIRDLHGSRLGIIGAGSIGRAVADIGRAFGMEVSFAARKKAPPQRGYRPFAELLAHSDVISLHLPLNAENKNLLAMPEFLLMRQRPLLINTARGGVVHEEDLVKALDQGLVGGIAFDVLSAEPPPQSHPLLALADRPNVLLTPHIAWASEQAMQSLWQQVIDNIDAFCAGKPRNLVTACPSA